MRQRQRPTVLLLALLLLLCGGCAPEEAATPAPPALTAEAKVQAKELLDAQLGALKDLLSETEYGRCLVLSEQLQPLRKARLDEGRYEKSGEEQRLVERLNQLYERYTVKYIADGGTWGYVSPAERTLAEYRIGADGGISPSGSVRETADWGAEDYRALWDQMRAILPQGAWRDFNRFTVFTDGPDETLAYVARTDSKGQRWEIAVDPADARDGEWFTETVLHEYSHYLTLNDKQVTYTDKQTASTYNEEGMVSGEDSYLNQFYQAFWTDYLDDRLANMESYNFFLRHEDDFVTDYASTDPAEDIAESFAYFVLRDRAQGDAVWQRKMNFFYAYPELVEFRREVRVRLKLG